MTKPADRLIAAVGPLIEATGSRLVDPDDRREGDVPLEWEGELVAAVRLGDLHGALDRMVTQVEEELGGALTDLPREKKQAAVRMLDNQGAFLLRKAIEDVADDMEVSRITIYNYLNAIRETDQG